MVSKKQFKERAKYFPKGSFRTRDDKTSMIVQADNYEILNKDLNRFGDKEQLLKKFKKAGVFE